MATEPVPAAQPSEGPFEGEPTIGRLVTDASRDISSLITKEIQLAKSELKVSVKAGGMGIGLFAAAAFVAMLAIIMLSVAFAYLINWNGEGLDLHWAFLIVFGVYLLVAALLASWASGRSSRSAARQGDPSGQGDPAGPQGPVTDAAAVTDYPRQPVAGSGRAHPAQSPVDTGSSLEIPVVALRATWSAVMA